MALYYSLPVYKDVYSLVLLMFEYTKEFPREYKYTLGQDIKRDAVQLVRSIYKANSVKEKSVYLERFMEEFEVLKLEVRLCVDLHIMTVKQQAHAAELIDRIL